MNEINPKDYTEFVVTGVLANGRRFKAMHFSGTLSGALHAFSINLWRGHVWGLKNGKRIKLKSVVN